MTKARYAVTRHIFELDNKPEIRGNALSFSHPNPSLEYGDIFEVRCGDTRQGKELIEFLAKAIEEYQQNHIGANSE